MQIRLLIRQPDLRLFCLQPMNIQLERAESVVSAWGGLLGSSANSVRAY